MDKIGKIAGTQFEGVTFHVKILSQRSNRIGRVIYEVEPVAGAGTFLTSLIYPLPASTYGDQTYTEEYQKHQYRLDTPQ